MEYRIMKIN